MYKYTINKYIFTTITMERDAKCVSCGHLCKIAYGEEICEECFYARHSFRRLCVSCHVMAPSIPMPHRIGRGPVFYCTSCNEKHKTQMAIADEKHKQQEAKWRELSSVNKY